MTDTHLVRDDLPAHCCQFCGEPVGYLGRFWGWLFGPEFHNCTRRNVQPPQPRGVNLHQIRDLLRPGLLMERGRISEDPFHPVVEFDIWVEADGGRLVLWALWKDRTEHKATILREDVQGDTSALITVYRKALRQISPEYADLDDIVIGFDDSGWHK